MLDALASVEEVEDLGKRISRMLWEENRAEEKKEIWGKWDQTPIRRRQPFCKHIVNNHNQPTKL